MEPTGLTQELFENKVHEFTLAFKDQDMEAAYLSGRDHFEFLSLSSKRFLYVVFFGFILLELDDMVSAIGLNPAYSFSVHDWLSYIWIIPSLAVEVFFYWCKPISKFRGWAITTCGCISFFQASFMDNAGFGGYPYFNS